MNLIKSIKALTKTQRKIWLISLSVILLSFLIAKSSDYMTVATSLVGATALIFVGKGDAIGQFLTMVFGILYAVISYQCRYYGEMITYLGMTFPSAAVAMLSWLRHPYAEREVKVNELHKKDWILLAVSSVFVTIGLGYVLYYFGTANLFFSILSITTSYFASMLTIMRSPYYAVAYALNDVVLIILWLLATVIEVAYLPMVICFLVFLVNDSYGFWNWQRMKKRQKNQ